MIVNVTIAPHEIMTLIAENLRQRFKGMVNHGPTEYVDVQFPTPPVPIVATLEVKRNPTDARD